VRYYPLDAFADLWLPIEPREMTFQKYVIPQLAERSAEMSEAAARLLQASRDAGRWVGVSWFDIVQQFSAENLVRCDAEYVMDFNARRRPGWVLNVLTLGLSWPWWWLTCERIPTDDLQSVALDQSDVLLVYEGFEQLAKLGYVHIQHPAREGDPQILYPTQALVELVAKP
jgi:hypothetical protein